MPFRQEPVGPAESFEDPLEAVLLPGVQDDLLIISGSRGEYRPDLSAQLIYIPALQGRNSDRRASAGQFLSASPAAPSWEVGFIQNDELFFRPVFAYQPFVLFAVLPGSVDDYEQAIGLPGNLLPPGYSCLFNGMDGPAQSGHVHEVKDDVVYDQLLPEEIPGRSREGGDDGPIFLEKRVEKGRLPDVRPTRDGQGDALAYGPAGFVAHDEPFDIDDYGSQGSPVGRAVLPKLFLGAFQAGFAPGKHGNALTAAPDNTA